MIEFIPVGSWWTCYLDMQEQRGFCGNWGPEGGWVHGIICPNDAGSFLVLHGTERTPLVFVYGCSSVCLRFCVKSLLRTRKRSRKTWVVLCRCEIYTLPLIWLEGLFGRWADWLSIGPSLVSKSGLRGIF